MSVGSRRRPPPPHHHRRAMTPASSVSVPAPVPAPPKPLYLRGPVIAGAVALAAFLLLAAAYATRRAGSPPAALLAHPAVSTRFFSFDLVREYPHDPAAFTQVLSICASLLFSSFFLMRDLISTTSQIRRGEFASCATSYYLSSPSLLDERVYKKDTIFSQFLFVRCILSYFSVLRM